MTYHQRVCVRSQVAIPINLDNDAAVASLTTGLLQAYNHTLDLQIDTLSVKHHLEVTSIEGRLSLRLIIAEHFLEPKPIRLYKPKYELEDPFELYQGDDDHAMELYQPRISWTPMELWFVKQQARLHRLEKRNLEEKRQKRFKVSISIDIPKDLAIVPANAHVIQSLVASALDTAFSRLCARRKIRKVPKHMLYNRQTMVTMTDSSGSDTWEMDPDAESSGWSSWGSEVASDDSECYNIEHKALSWAEESIFREDKALSRHRCFLQTRLRWSWTYEDDVDSEDQTSNGFENDLWELEDEFGRFLETSLVEGDESEMCSL